jgi:hypothetical protein
MIEGASRWGYDSTWQKHKIKEGYKEAKVNSN